MKLKYLFFLFIIVTKTSLFAQKMDTDSLLVATNKVISVEKNYTKAIALCQLGIKKAPNYLDFYVSLGNAYKMTNQIDSARYYFKYVIAKNTNYKEAFSYLTRLEIEQNKADAALQTIDQALVLCPEEKDFHLLKLRALELENNPKATATYLSFLIKKYPEDTTLKDRLFDMKLDAYGDRIGISNTTTVFNRSGVGPWNYTSLHYAKQLKNATIIGRFDYNDRQSSGTSVLSGSMYELETYYKTSPKNYSFLNIGISNDRIFPKVRLNYSFFQNLGKGWETELGIRYNKTNTTENYSTALGFGKYLGAGWFNLRSYFQIGQKKPYPSFASTYRYYFNSRYDYFAINAGYGTSPDERETISQFDQRVSLNSYRIGAGYNKVVFKKFIIGAQTGFNRQEYTPSKYQNEINITLQLQWLL
ncbi:YaiO family outer membrane beta-barrel protein [Flavobacterium restrictum]|uniref:YaiO family outer membrane beta-barrel protein n=2 Tax=Flavobacterium restrictum TaxID=2594428 RepID=A0A553ECQ7_9FLAO|nr:YaiO family outer membrane beta-barrel protein [Flavobacterium restrictum]